MDLVGLNSYRRKIFVERAKAVAAAAAATRQHMAMAKANASAQSSTQPHALLSCQIQTAESQTNSFATSSTYAATHATLPLGNATKGSSIQDATTASSNTGPHLDSEVVL